MLKRGKKTSKILIIAMTVIMVLTMIPSVAFAGENNAEDFPSSYGYDETDAESVTVYVTVSNDGMPLLANNEEKTVMAQEKVEVPYFDLAKYGLDNYYRYETENGYGPYINEKVVERPTLLHLFIYIAEKYYMGLSEEECGNGSSGVLDYRETKDLIYMDGCDAYTSMLGALVGTGSACSIYFNGGFWGHDENLNYYRNHRYPLMSEGWGATADYILLSNGDMIDVALNSDWNKIFQGFFLSFNKDDYTVKPGEKLEVNIMGTARMATGRVNEETSLSDHNEEVEIKLYDSGWNWIESEVEYDGRSGYVIQMPQEEGEYYILGMSYLAQSNSGVDAPAVAKVIVKDDSVKPEPELTPEPEPTPTPEPTPEPEPAPEPEPTPEPEQPQQPSEDEIRAEAVKSAEITAQAKALSYAKVKVSWNKVEAADKYEVYRSTDKNGKYSKVYTTANTSISNTKNVKTGKTYYYKIRALAEISGETVYSDYSQVKSAKPVLAKVNGVKVKPGKKKVTVSWKKVTGANGYAIYRADKASGKYKLVKTVKKGSVLKWTNTKLKKGKTYRYKVKAYRTVDGKKVYSPSYSAIVKAKAK